MDKEEISFEEFSSRCRAKTEEINKIFHDEHNSVITTVLINTLAFVMVDSQIKIEPILTILKDTYKRVIEIATKRVGMQWISVKDKYPLDGQKVMALFGGEEHVTVFTDRECYRSWAISTYKGTLLPTHWRPLPEAPKELNGIN